MNGRGSTTRDGRRARAWRSLPLFALAVAAGACASSSPTAPPSSVASTSAAASPAGTAITSSPPTPSSAASIASPAATPAPTRTASPGPVASASASASGSGQGNAAQWLAFVVPSGSASGGAWVIRSDGHGRRSLGAATEASWRPDGAAVRIVRPDSHCIPSLIEVPLSAAAPKTLPGSFQPSDRGFAWSPDGRRVAFLRLTSGEPAGYCGAQGGVYPPHALDTDVILLDLPTAQTRTLATATSANRLAWLPDGKALVADWTTAASPMKRIPINGGSATGIGTPSIGSISHLAISRDGKRLAYVAARPNAFGSSLHVSRIDGTADRDLGLADTSDHWAAWSPSGASLALLREVPRQGGLFGQIYLVDSATGAARSIDDAEVNAFAATAWSRDGSALAYVRQTIDPYGVRPGPIRVARADGTGIHDLPGTDAAEWLAWQP